ncbi:MAG: TIGR00296 family protein [Nitrososphaera sp.]
MLSDTQGASLVQLARSAVERYITNPFSAAADLIKDGGASASIDGNLRAGVFVTLNLLDDDGDGNGDGSSSGKEQLRGCIGFPLPYKRLHQSVVEAAIAAATEDPRFEPVSAGELGKITFEVSVLTELAELVAPSRRPDDYRKLVRIGRDGLMLRSRYGSGLLLPQVPVEWGWDVDEYLANICYKAGAPPDAWLDPSSKLYTFQAIVFKEMEPRGRVARLSLARQH